MQNMRKNWHQPCADIWVIANSATKARKFVFTREHGTCQGPDCSFKSLMMKDFHVDHIVPLFEAEGQLVYYTAANMQLLCHACHRTKTAEDMRRYRARAVS